VRFAINAPNFGTFAETRLLASLAQEAESAGWDGFFLWDHIRPGPVPLSDPWIQLAAMAMNTSQIKLGTMVTPLPRRKPEEVARQTVTLDRLSGGRLILGVGLGDDMWNEYSAFGGAMDARVRGEMLDEGLAVITALWSGKAVTYKGKHYCVQDAVFQPTPLQQPRIPVWIGGRWPAKRPFLRAARWDGVAPVSQAGAMTPAICREIVGFTLRHRKLDSPFEVAVAGRYPTRQRVQEFAEAGATWYQVGLSAGTPFDEALQVIRRGPP
jgi:alkanesulfonate monooxygenase SsuD/methylene tetrahydromethanopterin reductase-like flavin-dependent oxidoreductase (luciferase family)